MRNIKLTLAYDGTDSHGWQIQPGQPTIQGVLGEVLQQITQQPVTLHGAGRTDAGVHSWGQVANFSTNSLLTPEDFTRALNALLPPTIRIRHAEEVPPDFHARWHAQAKTYVYRIYRGEVLPPFISRYVLHHPYPLDFDAMSDAARAFIGEHDFSSFAASSGSDEIDDDRITTRTIFNSEILACGRPSQSAAHAFRRDIKTPSWSGVLAPESQMDPLSESSLPDGLSVGRPSGVSTSALLSREFFQPLPGPDEWVYVVRGKSFLRNMVRKIVGTLLDVGRGRLQPADIPRILALRDRTQSGPTASPHALCLLSVEYGNKP